MKAQDDTKKIYKRNGGFLYIYNIYREKNKIGKDEDDVQRLEILRKNIRSKRKKCQGSSEYAWVRSWREFNRLQGQASHIYALWILV